MKTQTRFDEKQQSALLVNELFGGRDKLLALLEHLQVTNEYIVDTAIKGNDFGVFRRERLIEATGDFLKQLDYAGVKVLVKSTGKGGYQYYEIHSKNFVMNIGLNNGNTHKSRYVKQNAKRNENFFPEQPNLSNDPLFFKPMTLDLFDDNKLFVILNIHVHKKHLDFSVYVPHFEDTRMNGSSLAIWTIEKLLDSCDKMASTKPVPPAPKPTSPKSKKKYSGE